MKKLSETIRIGCLLLCALCACSGISSTTDRHLTVIAHRGDSMNAPENTLAAFRGAVQAGADYVELDARPSADGTLYVLHDDTLDRTTDGVRLVGHKKVLIKETPDAQIARLDAGTWFNPRFAGEPVPTLAAALDVIQAKSRTLLERKDGSAEAYVRLLREKGLVGKLIVQSFDWPFLTALHELEPEQSLGALGEKGLDEAQWTKLAATGTRLVGWKYTDLNDDLIAEFHRRGYRVWAWTADEPADWERLVASGVDGIITNRPGQLRAWLGVHPKTVWHGLPARGASARCRCHTGFWDAFLVRPSNALDGRDCGLDAGPVVRESNGKAIPTGTGHDCGSLDGHGVRDGAARRCGDHVNPLSFGRMELPA